MRDLCDRLNIVDEDLKRKIWTCFELSLRNHTKLMKDRHIDQLLMCSIYAMCKVSRHDVSFQDIMKNYRLQPQAKSHVSGNRIYLIHSSFKIFINIQVYRSVLLTSRTRRNSASSENSRHSDSNSPVASQEEKDGIRSNSTLPVPHPSSQPPTPTRLAGTGSQFDFGEERGDLIMFYNQIYIPELKTYIMKFTAEVRFINRRSTLLNICLNLEPLAYPISTSSIGSEPCITLSTTFTAAQSLHISYESAKFPLIAKQTTVV